MARIVYPAGGWLAPGTSVNWQREDQGQDFVIPWKAVVQAPGSGSCVGVGSDAAFPSGFGPRYAIVEIHTGRWAGHSWYIGHCTSLVAPGDKFAFGRPIAKADQGHNFNGTLGGWVELGERLPDGSLGPNTTNHWYKGLFSDYVVKAPDPPLKYGDWGWRVIGMTSNLATCGWLPRMQWKFDAKVHGAVVAFKKHHHIAIGPPDGGIVDAATDVVLAHAAAVCKKNKKPETP